MKNQLITSQIIEWFKINNCKPGYIMSAQQYLNYRNEILKKYDEQAIKEAIDSCILKGFIELNDSGNFVLTQVGYEMIVNDKI